MNASPELSSQLRAVAFVEDDDATRHANTESLTLSGFDVVAFASASKALAGITADFPGVVVTDIRMPKMDGRQLFQRLRALDSDLPVIFITGHADVTEAVEALHEGAYDFVAKPFSKERLLQAITGGLEKRRLALDNRRLRALAADAETELPIIGQSDAVERMRVAIRQVAHADVDAIIEGETGAGKELAARALHNWGPRRGRPFVALNCGALPAELLESELFGHEPGAFAGAMRARMGRIESAHNGTLFLDEIETLHETAQIKLLRFLAEKEVCRLGSNQGRFVDVRVIAASKSIQNALDQGLLRPDFYHRLNVATIYVPPLRERRSDIPLLFAHFVGSAADRQKCEPPPITEGARRMLFNYDWPGNIRELANFAARVVIGLTDDSLSAGDGGDLSLRERVDRFEIELIREALAANNGNVVAAIQALRLPRKTFYDKVKRHGIDIDFHRRAKGVANRDADR